jgi:hypothetical protein
MGKDIEILRIDLESRVNNNKELIEENKIIYKSIQQDLNEIKTALNLKQDKKFVE